MFLRLFTQMDGIAKKEIQILGQFANVFNAQLKNNTNVICIVQNAKLGISGYANVGCSYPETVLAHIF